MMHYKKGRNVEEELTKDNIEMDCLPEKFLWMHVKGGTKVSNVINYAKKALDSGEYRSIVWSGSEGGVVKTISCAEILKRQYDLHQITKICYRKIDEYWEPQLEGLTEIVANRRVPCIHILLTLDSINPNLASYQNSKTKTKFYKESSNDKESGSSRERKHKFHKDNQNKYQKYKNDRNSERKEQNNL